MAHWYPRAGGAERPSASWYWGWALYVNRGGFARAFARLGPFGAAVLVAAVLLPYAWLRTAAVGVVVAGALILVHSIIGHALVYGRPSGRYFDRLLVLGGVRDVRSERTPYAVDIFAADG